MATAPTTPDVQQSGAAQSAAPDSTQQTPSAAPANNVQMLLARIYMGLKQLASQAPAASAGLAKAMQGIQEAQSAMLTNSQPPSSESNPSY